MEDGHTLEEGQWRQTQANIEQVNHAMYFH